MLAHLSNSRTYFKLLLVCTILSFFNCKNTTEIKEEPTANTVTPPVFDKVASSYSNLYFENALAEDVSTMENLFNYDYFYNGAGVGVEDLNNDGLLDIFFCGNQMDNKLYKNKGELQFEDVSAQANINLGKNWSNGITFVDINNDSLIDIYVSQGGPYTREKRKNLLYINKGEFNFEEKAEEFGLADMGISTQTAFFDYDNDGDLDCLVMNENELYGVDPINLKRLIAQNKETKHFNSSHLYRNENGTFVNTTAESGLERPIFGLGVSVSDFNNDGWLDFYIASDYYIPDCLFINNQDGTYSDKIKEYTNQISFYGMGMDIADINNDNLQDIFVLDMAANDHVRSKTLMASMNTERFDYLVNKADYHYQYMYNSLQLNSGLGKYTNISQSTTMANTDWSWSVLMTDFDHDEDKDVYITNGYRRYALDNDLQNKVYQAKLKYKNKVPIALKQSLYDAMPSEKLENILYENNGNLEFSEKAKSWGLADYSFSNGAAMGDFDNDGDMDLVVNNIDENCFLYKNTSVENNRGNFLKVKALGELSESFPTISIAYDGKSQLLEIRRVRGYRSSHENVAHFGLGNTKVIDTVSVVWPDGSSEKKYNVAANTSLVFDKKNALASHKSNQKTTAPIFREVTPSALGIDFSHKENYYDDFEKEILLPYKQSTLGPSVTKGDFNADSLPDFYVGGASGQPGAIYLQKSSGGFYKKTNSQFENDKVHEDMEAVIFDWDNDGDNDLFVVSGGNEFAQHSSYYADRLYLNDGKGNMKRFESASLNKNPKSGKTVTTIDFDQDGDQDLLIGNRVLPQNYPIANPSILYENRNGELVDVTEKIAPELSNFGIINSIITTDFNNDGKQDFIAVGEWTAIGIFKNENGSFKRISADNTVLNQKGWWFSIKETDINNDGLPDYLVGNVGSNLKFKASVKKPFKVFVNDFDENGTQDIVLSKEYKGAYVPVRGRECSSQQMPFIQQKFESYSEFANAKLTDIYGDKLNSAYEGEVTEFKSILLTNLGDGSFQSTYLPNQAQFFPILESVFIDVNNDGYEDAIIAGNIFNTEVETPRLDAISGQVLLSNGKDGYTPLSWQASGLLLDGNVKDLEIINENTVIAVQNDGPPMTFVLKK